MFRASRQMVHGQLKLHVQRMLDRLHDTQRLNITVLYKRKTGILPNALTQVLGVRFWI